MSGHTLTARRASIIIPNYNGRSHLERLLPSIADQTYTDYEVIVIDDCSSDRGAVEYIRAFIRDHDNMRLIENPENLGFVKTCNSGFRLARGEYVCILTNDTEVRRDFVERNVGVMGEDATIGILSCVVVDQDGNNWFTGGSFRGGFRVNLKDDFQGIRPVDWVAGTACFYRRELLDKVGLLDASYVMYHEDIDFCLRVKQETEYKVCVFSDKLVTHYLRNAKASGIDRAKLLRQRYYGHRNHLLLLTRYSPGSKRKVLAYYVLELTKDTIVLPVVGALTSIRRLDPAYFMTWIQAVAASAKGTIDGLRMRRNG